jgi:hypothetical protein
MRNRVYIVLILFLAMALTACQRVIDIKLSSAAPLLVIEGNITNVSGVQTISLSSTVSYNDANVYPPVTGATITAATGGINYVFRETYPGQYTLLNFRAKPGQTYALKVQTDTKSYTATSTMPTPVLLDSVGVSSITVGTKTVKTVSVFYHDAPGTVNQYRFVMYVNTVQVKQIFTVNDALTDGRIVNNMLYQDDITLKTGDKIDVEMQCIDKGVYDYFYSLSQQGGNGPNNSATPSNPLSNFDNGALGYFSVHTTQKKSIVVL